MTLDLETTQKNHPEIQLVHPGTGELVQPDEIDKIAEALDYCKMAKQRWQDAIDAFSAALIEHSKIVGAKTFHAGSTTVTVSPDKELSWDIDYLDTALSEAGLPEDRIRALITTTVSYKVNAAVANQIAASNPEYAEIIAKAKTYTPKRQYVSVKP